MKVVVLLILFLALAGAAVAIGGFYWATGASGEQGPVEVTVPVGATGEDVARILKEEEVIRSSFAFRLMAALKGAANDFQAGKYRLTTNMTASDVLAALADGPFVETVSVTFPEGLTVSETAARANEGLGVSREEMTKAARSGRYSLPPYLPKGAPTVEGFLFPDTYDFLKDATPDAVIRRLLAGFDEHAKGLPWSRAGTLGVSPYEVVVIASMIEREARVPGDRSKVAAVIHNRLKKGMLLQIDATIQYALGRQKSALTFDDLKVDSPYNTYLHAGLPPTPIASPGRASLEAALNPADADYLYYVVIDDEGHHAFTDSYQEFLRLKEGGG